MIVQYIGSEDMVWRPAGSSNVSIRADEDSTSTLGAVITIIATLFDFITAIQKPNEDVAKGLAFQSVYATLVEQVDPHPTGESLDLLLWHLQICHFSSERRGYAPIEYTECFQNYIAYLRLMSNNDFKGNPHTQHSRTWMKV